ncbi:hypothetical protein [Streptomyces collinus]|uniref:Acetyltransferase n=1 Tax=Streptomyces collinus (strain DSM 40733 / Tue 365) TaxID=1214242 RepID=S5VA79_STRC3|nr:acetyltransferase [Streptomyces collinus Tu 365]
MVEWGIRPASEADVEAVAEPRAVVLRAALRRLGRYDVLMVREPAAAAAVPESRPTR